jgi:hypothetical protein
MATLLEMKLTVSGNAVPARRMIYSRVGVLVCDTGGAGFVNQIVEVSGGSGTRNIAVGHMAWAG